MECFPVRIEDDRARLHMQFLHFQCPEGASCKSIAEQGHPESLPGFYRIDQDSASPSDSVILLVDNQLRDDGSRHRLYSANSSTETLNHIWTRLASETKGEEFEEAFGIRTFETRSLNDVSQFETRASSNQRNRQLHPSESSINFSNWSAASSESISFQPVPSVHVSAMHVADISNMTGTTSPFVFYTLSNAKFRIFPCPVSGRCLGANKYVADWL